jgi:hypothetical protein
LDGKTSGPVGPTDYPGKPAAAGDLQALDDDDQAAISAYLSDSHALHTPAVDSVFFESILSGAQITDETRKIARAYHDDGFVVLENLFEPELIDTLAGRFPWMFDKATIETLPPHVQELFNLDPARRLDAWWACDEVRQLACHPRILELLQLLYGRRPIPFQTLNFLYGTEQPAHSDAIHFSCIPAGFMCGVWVALEDATLENGTLAYYPGSHKLPDVQLSQLGIWGQEGYTAHGGDYGRYENYVRAVVHTHGLKEKRLEVPKGSALIWSSNLLHGGTAITKPGATRMSQVTHYYFEGCTYYAPILSDGALGEYRLKAVHDLSTNKSVPHTINGDPLTIIPGSNGRSRISKEGSNTDWGIDPELLERIEKLQKDLDAPANPTNGEKPAHTEAERLRLYVRALEAERDHLQGRVHNLEQTLRDKHGDAVHRVLDAVKGLKDRISGGKP